MYKRLDKFSYATREVGLLTHTQKAAINNSSAIRGYCQEANP